MTIWANYGPYHLARVAALEAVGYGVTAFSQGSSSQRYPFFTYRPPRHVLINDCPMEQVRSLTSFRKTLTLLRAHHPRVVLACGYERPETAAALLYARLQTVGERPTVLIMLDNKLDDRVRSRLVELVKKRYLRWFDGFLVSGSEAQAYLEVLGLANRPIGTAYDCVDNDWIAAAAREAREQDSCRAGAEDYFLCVSRMLDRKNLPFLVSAYKRYHDSLPAGMKAWNLVLCGDGPARPKVEDAVIRNGVTGAVVLTGVVSDPMVLVNYYAFARVAILPSVAGEPWGLVVNEAMAAELPVLVSKRCGSAADLVDEGWNGFTFDPTDEEGLARLMRRMHCHQERLPKMGARSVHLVQRFSPERFAQEVMRVEAEAVQRRRQHFHA